MRIHDGTLSPGAKGFIKDEAGASKSFRAAEVQCLQVQQIFSRSLVFFDDFFFSKKVFLLCHSAAMSLSSPRQRLIFRIESRADFDGRLKALRGKLSVLTQLNLTGPWG